MLQVTMLSVSILYEACPNVCHDHLSKPLHVCKTCVCTCLDALTTASCSLRRHTLACCITMEVDYTLKVYSESHWAKHKTTRRSVSSGFLFFFGNLLYPTFKTQKALALSSAEPGIYSAAGACCDGVLMYHCLSFAIGSDLEVKFRLCIDNAAARAFFCRSGMGHIRHICLRILWVQSEVKKNNFAHRTSYKRQSVRYWHETFDQPQSHLPNPSCIPHHLFPRPRSPQSQWHQLAMPIWLAFVPWQACENLAFWRCHTAASTTASALWLSVETRSQNVHTSWSFPTRLKTLDAYLVA